MKRWVPSRETVGQLHVASWVGFIVFLSLAVLLATGWLALPIGVIFVCFPFVFLVFWPAVSIVATRADSSQPLDPLNWRATWKIVFAGVPGTLSTFVVLYFYGVVGWLLMAGAFTPRASSEVSDLGPWAVGFFALPSVFALIAAAVFLGYLRSSTDAQMRI